MRSDDIAELIGDQQPSEDIKFHQGLVVAWDAATGANTISVAGSNLTDLPVLTSAGLVSLRVGDAVGVLKVKSALFIVGRIVPPDSGLAQPQWPIVLYPQFQPLTALGAGGYATVNAGTLVSWEGRIRASHPKVDVDGIWGIASGSGSATYAVKLGGNSVGEWTISSGLHTEKGSVLAGLSTGGFDITGFLGQDWLKIEVAITASTGTGERACQVLGAYFRQS